MSFGIYFLYGWGGMVKVSLWPAAKQHIKKQKFLQEYIHLIKVLEKQVPFLSVSTRKSFHYDTCMVLSVIEKFKPKVAKNSSKHFGYSFNLRERRSQFTPVWETGPLAGTDEAAYFWKESEMKCSKAEVYTLWSIWVFSDHDRVRS